jgi:hypothetical protein
MSGAVDTFNSPLFINSRKIMKIIKNLLSACAMACVLASGTAFAGDADFVLLNRTGYTLREVYLSPSSANSWGNDRMGQGYLDHAKSRTFKFASKSACKQDLKVVFDDDASEVIWENFDLCEINKITLKYNRSSKEVSAEIE